MSHERISPTAWLIAYQRTLTDIPFSKELFQELDKLVQGMEAASEVERMRSAQLAVMWESRFKIVNHLLKANQVLEIAAGFSPRGLDITRDPAVTYVELDLSGLIRDKQHIIDTLVGEGKIPARANLHLVEGNALSLDDLRSAARFFADAPIAVVNEGLISYLNRAERTQLAQNVHALLQQFGGVWITPDIEIQLPQGDTPQIAEEIKGRMARIEKLTGVDINQNRFASEDEARQFYEQLGFEVERHRFMEIADQITLPPADSLPRTVLERSVAFVMTTRKG